MVEDADGPEVLMQLRSNMAHEGGTWSCPGGAINEGETTLEAALRESTEEVGAPPEPWRVVGEHVFTPAEDWSYTTAVVVVSERFGASLNFETTDVRWVPVAEIEKLPLHAGFAASWPDVKEIVLRGDDGEGATRPATRAVNISSMFERRQGQASLEVVAERFRTVFRDSPVGFVLLDPTGKVVFANPSFGHMVDGDPAEMVGEDLTDRVFAEDVAFVVAARDRALAGAVHRTSISVRFAARGEVRWAELDLRVIHDRDGDPLMMPIHVLDRTEYMGVLGQLGHADRVDLVSHMAIGIGHDLRNALTILRAHVELLEGDPTGSEADRTTVLASMRAAVDRALALSSRMVGFVRTSQPGREVVDLGGLVRSLAPVFEAVSGAASVEVECEGAALVEADGVEVERVLLSIVTNALDALAADGTVRIEVSPVDRPDGAGADQVRLRVSDTGSGMDAETLERAFDPYFTTKATGTGLGLPTSRSLIEALGGAFHLSSTPGSGTVVDVLLPAAGGNRA